VPTENVIDSIDVKNIFWVPLNYLKQGMDELVLKQFKLPITESKIKYWQDLVNKVDNLKEEVEIALVGKYVELHDAYLSVNESLKHAGYANNVRVKVNWINSEDLEKMDSLDEVFKTTSGILVPGGFGSRGIEGKIKAINYARTHNIPFLGICLGMQLAVIEFARNVCGLPNASSTEFNEVCKDPIIDLMAEQKGIINKGGTLRLGNYDCKIKEGTLAFEDYKILEIKERHRHRYEFNNKYKELLASKGMVFSGINEKADLVEIIELKNHPHFIACQFHPEFKSRPTRPHPLFNSFIRESIKHK
jgi:CTP synthase